MEPEWSWVGASKDSPKETLARSLLGVLLREVSSKVGRLIQAAVSVSANRLVSGLVCMPSWPWICKVRRMNTAHGDPDEPSDPS